MSSQHASDDRCQEVFEMLSDYLDGELTAAECEEIETHISACPPCVDFLDSLKGSVSLARSYTASEAPSPLPPKIRAALLAAYQNSMARRP